jgi:hypothetical protein
MAMINKKNGNYLRISNIRFDNNTVEYNIYRDAQIREDEKNGIVSEYEIIKNGSWNTDVIPEVIAVSLPPQGKGILDGLKTLCYEKMLEDSAFIDWQSDEIIN